MKAQDISLRTNLLYDVFLAPSVGVEVGVKPCITVVGNWAYNWMGLSGWGSHLHVVSLDVEGRYWLDSAISDTDSSTPRRGYYAGGYLGYYRYDMLFGRSGQQAKANFGLGV